jgi:choline dehydrogenase-like flavoprotein
VRGIEGVYVVDASIFPSPSAVNPQATIMALSDVITRRIGDLAV